MYSKGWTSAMIANTCKEGSLTGREKGPRTYWLEGSLTYWEYRSLLVQGADTRSPAALPAFSRGTSIIWQKTCILQGNNGKIYGIIGNVGKIPFGLLYYCTIY